MLAICPAAGIQRGGYTLDLIQPGHSAEAPIRLA
jgi:hypothetical protein